jgi:hypothetical protein
MAEWISVKDRLPEETKKGYSDCVLVLGKALGEFYHGIGYYVFDKFWPPHWNCSGNWDEECDSLDITHWMPLPEPPKECEDCKWYDHEDPVTGESGCTYCKSDKRCWEAKDG